MMIAAAGGEENLPIRELILRIEAGDKPIRELVLRIGAGDRRTPILNTQPLTVYDSCFESCFILRPKSKENNKFLLKRGMAAWDGAEAAEAV